MHLFPINFSWGEQGIKVSPDLIWRAIWTSCASAGGIIGMRPKKAITVLGGSCFAKNNTYRNSNRMSRSVIWGFPELSSVSNINSQGETILNCEFHSLFLPDKKTTSLERLQAKEYCSTCHHSKLIFCGETTTTEQILWKWWRYWPAQPKLLFTERRPSWEKQQLSFSLRKLFQKGSNMLPVRARSCAFSQAVHKEMEALQTCTRLFKPRPWFLWLK